MRAAMLLPLCLVCNLLLLSFAGTSAANPPAVPSAKSPSPVLLRPKPAPAPFVAPSGVVRQQIADLVQAQRLADAQFQRLLVLLDLGLTRVDQLFVRPDQADFVISNLRGTVLLGLKQTSLDMSKNFTITTVTPWVASPSFWEDEIYYTVVYITQGRFLLARRELELARRETENARVLVRNAYIQRIGELQR